MSVDVAIIGGGIAGLWLLARLREQGYGALLVEGERLGTGQTLCAQGIIHGGAKYGLHGQAGNTAAAVAAMPALWRRSLRGEGEVDLRGATLLAEHQYLWATCAPTSRLATFFASKLMRGRVEKVDAGESALDERPPVLRHPDFHGAIYRLDEPIIDVATVLKTLAGRYQAALFLNHGPVALNADGALTLQHPDRVPCVIQPAVTIFTAGAGNAALPWAKQQLRPLHMVMARGDDLPGPLYAHCIGLSDVPRLTVTSHQDAQGRLIWYLGGGLAEEGVHRDRQAQIQATRQELAALFPWVNWGPVELATLMIERAEAQQPGGGRPAGVSVRQNGRMIVAWPTKLALAPVLARQIEEVLLTLKVQPHPVDFGPLADWPHPDIGVYPWDREDLEWS